jgi:hypothetical protein
MTLISAIYITKKLLLMEDLQINQELFEHCITFCVCYCIASFELYSSPYKPELQKSNKVLKLYFPLLAPNNQTIAMYLYISSFDTSIQMSYIQ